MTHSKPKSEPSVQDGEPKAPDATEGLRLLKAFLSITTPEARALVIEFAEGLAPQQKSETD